MVPQNGSFSLTLVKVSLKAVLLYNDDEKPSITLARATSLKETYESMQLLLKLIIYKRRNWNVCGNRQVISLLFDPQIDHTTDICYCVSGIAEVMTATTKDVTGNLELNM